MNRVIKHLKHTLQISAIVGPAQAMSMYVWVRFIEWHYGVELINKLYDIMSVNMWLWYFGILFGMSFMGSLLYSLALFEYDDISE